MSLDLNKINRTFIRENTQCLACNEECAFFTSDVYNNHYLWSCQKVCDALLYLLDNIFIRFGTSYGVYISQFIRFARASSNLNDFNYRNKALTAKLLRQGYRYFKLRKAFSKFLTQTQCLVRNNI